jgi:hypothetical protein
MTTIIDTPEEWKWYKRKLDADGSYEHDHHGHPEKFPCKVMSQWHDQENVPYYFKHRFVYQVEKVCDKCGHKHMEWDVDTLTP